MHYSDKHLRIFRAAMMHGGATGAAAAVNMTQPAVSRILKDFEAIVGFPLFERERAGLRPTKEATALFVEVDRAHAALERVGEAARAIRHKESGQLRITAIAVDVDGVLSRRIGGFLAGMPGIRFQMISATKPEIEKLVATEQVDLGILTLPIAGDMVRVCQEYKRQAVGILPKGHELAARHKIRLEDVVAPDWIHLIPGSPLRMALDRELSENGLVPDVRIELETQRATVNMVRQGMGCAIVDPALLTDEECSLLEIRPMEPALSWTQAVIVARRSRPSQIAEAFLAWLGTHFGDQAGSGNRT